MKVHNISILGFFIGVVVIASSIARWFFFYHDPSSAYFGVAIGLIVIIFSYIYSWMREVDQSIYDLGKRTDAVVDWFMDRQKESILNQAKGVKNE